MADNNGKSKLSPFTPTFDILVKKYDGEAALTYGYVWRMNKLRKGVCDASHETIGAAIGVSYKAVARRLKILIQDGWIHDADPGKRNDPHRLYITTKLDLEHELGRTACPTIGRTESPSQTDSQSYEDTGNISASESTITEDERRSLHNPPNSKNKNFSNMGGDNSSQPLPPLIPEIPSSHPAIKAIKKACGYYPRKPIRQAIVNLLGETITPDVQDSLNKAAALWLGGGTTHDPLNLNAWLFDRWKTDNYYMNPNDKGILDYMTPHSSEPDTNQPATPPEEQPSPLPEELFKGLWEEAMVMPNSKPIEAPATPRPSPEEVRRMMAAKAEELSANSKRKPGAPYKTSEPETPKQI